MKFAFTIIFTLLIGSFFSENINKVFTSDIDNFWIAYDSIQKTSDYSKKLDFINRLYIGQRHQRFESLHESRKL